jgi:hypothetical protein
MPKKTIHYTLLKRVMLQTRIFTTGLHYLLYIITTSTLCYSCFLSLLVASLSGVGDHSSTNFIEGGGLKRSSSPPKASPAVPEGPASIPTGSAGTLGCMLELALLGKSIQRGSKNSVNRVSTRDGNSSIKFSLSRALYEGIYRCLSAQCLGLRTHVPSGA